MSHRNQQLIAFSACFRMANSGTSSNTLHRDVRELCETDYLKGCRGSAFARKLQTLQDVYLAVSESSNMGLTQGLQIWNRLIYPGLVCGVLEGRFADELAQLVSFASRASELAAQLSVPESEDVVDAVEVQVRAEKIADQALLKMEIWAADGQVDTGYADGLRDIWYDCALAVAKEIVRVDGYRVSLESCARSLAEVEGFATLRTVSLAGQPNALQDLRKLLTRVRSLSPRSKANGSSIWSKRLVVLAYHLALGDRRGVSEILATEDLAARM